MGDDRSLLVCCMHKDLSFSLPTIAFSYFRCGGTLIQLDMKSNVCQTYYRAVDAAHSAFQSWRTKSLSERKAAMQKVSDVFSANVDELAELLVLEQGKPLEAAKGEVMGVSYLLQKAMDIKNEPEVYSDTPERRVEVRRVPIGVVACITPWNFPLFCSVQKWAPAVSSWFGIIDVYGMY